MQARSPLSWAARGSSSRPFWDMPPPTCRPLSQRNALPPTGAQAETRAAPRDPCRQQLASTPIAPGHPVFLPWLGFTLWLPACPPMNPTQGGLPS